MTAPFATLHTLFGLTVPVSRFPLSADLARALVKRINDAARAMNEEDVPIARAAKLRHDAARYVAVRRTRELRMSVSHERSGDASARALMRMTANTPPQRVVAEKLVA